MFITSSRFKKLVRTKILYFSLRNERRIEFNSNLKSLSIESVDQERCVHLVILKAFLDVQEALTVKHFVLQTLLVLVEELHQ